MDPRLLDYYKRELQHLRELGGEFAREFPKIAGPASGSTAFECADPYVERLLEGFAFLAARVQLKLDAEFPRFTQHLLEMVYPHYLAPTPSMAVVQLQPNLREGALADGFVVPRGTVLRSRLGKRRADRLRVPHRRTTSTLWPLELVERRVLDVPRRPRRACELASGKRRARRRCACGCATAGGLTLRPAGARPTCRCSCAGSDELAMRLYEQLLGGAVGRRSCGRARPARLARGGRRRRRATRARLRRRRGAAALRRRARSRATGCCTSTSPSRSASCSSSCAGSAAAVRRCAGNELEIVRAARPPRRRARGRGRRRALRACSARRRSTCSRSAPTAST